ncbi:MAG TPA: YciI family protein [Acidothermaceae bacterium]|jgi:hypothetical protein
MAKFLVLIYGDEVRWSAMAADEMRAHDAAHVAFSKAAGSRIINGEELDSPSKARTVRRRHQARTAAATDGPFMETKEILGGYYLLEAADLDEVEELVALLPEVQADHSGVEIRPVVDHG